ncbi:unannotated protein [freshwater metagenome]|uniref:Unannotated protein n=1 Tax=freshwater metagenome TaxID=449393 RepID=A0A6J6ZK75_9ZZZZ
MPTVTDDPPDVGTLIARLPSIALPPTTGAVNRFIAGEPIKPATNTFCGFS